MKMEIFEYAVCANEEEVAGFNNLDHAKAFARHLANEEHCNVDVIDVFTGEVHQSLICYTHTAYSPLKKEAFTFYKVKEREW